MMTGKQLRSWALGLAHRWFEDRHSVTREPLEEVIMGAYIIGATHALAAERQRIEADTARLQGEQHATTQSQDGHPGQRRAARSHGA